MERVIVVGSINQDVTVTVDRFPQPGETLSGSSLTYSLGGKGANQAAAMALGKPFDEAVADGIRAGSTAVLAPGAAPSYTSLPRVTRS